MKKVYAVYTKGTRNEYDTLASAKEFQRMLLLVEVKSTIKIESNYTITERAYRTEED